MYASFGKPIRLALTVPQLNWFYFLLLSQQSAHSTWRDIKNNTSRQTAACCHSRAPSRKGAVENSVALILL